MQENKININDIPRKEYIVILKSWTTGEIIERKISHVLGVESLGISIKFLSSDKYIKQHPRTFQVISINQIIK